MYARHAGNRQVDEAMTLAAHWDIHPQERQPHLKKPVQTFRGVQESVSAEGHSELVLLGI